MIRYPYEIINVEKKYELPNNLVDEHNRYVELKLTDYDTMQQPERNELNDLSELLYPYNISSGDWNKFQEITANLQKFITIDLVNYINESYFSMDDVRNEIDLKINIFKNGDLKTIIYDMLKQWGGGDYLGKEMIPIFKTLDSSVDPTDMTFTYENNRGGLLKILITAWKDDTITLVVDDKILINKESHTKYGSFYGNEGAGGTEWYEYIIPFSSKVSISHYYNEPYVGHLQIKGFAYINPKIV